MSGRRGRTPLRTNLTSRERVTMAGSMAVLAVVVAALPWAADALATTPVVAREQGAIAAYAVAAALVTIAAADLGAAAVLRRRRELVRSLARVVGGVRRPAADDDARVGSARDA